MPHTSVRLATLVVGAFLAQSLAACAAAPPGGVAPTVAALPVGGSGGASRGVGLEVTTRNDGSQAVFAADPAAVFAALEASYIALAIPLSKRDDSARMLGNDGIRMRRQLGRIELRRAFDCGGTSGMPNSETYTIIAGITTSVAADPEKGSVITTVIDASAENPNYPGSGVRCSSTGTLEEAIVKEIRARLNSRP